MTTTTVYATKGGQGTTTITAMLGLLHAHAGHRTLLIDTNHDLPAILNTPDPGPGLTNYLTDTHITLADVTMNVCENLDLIPTGTGSAKFTMFTYGLLTGGLDHYDHVIIDAATHATEWNTLADRTIYITRPCYLSLRRAITTPRPTHVIYMHEDNRSLGARDIETVLGIPVTATIHHDHQIARTIDAGLLLARPPRPLTRALRHLVQANEATR